VRTGLSKDRLTRLGVVGVVRELRAPRTGGPLVVAGAPALVPLLARELRAGGDESAVRENGSLDGAAALVWVGDPDVEALRAASRAHVPIVAVTEADRVPYVLETSVVTVRPGESFPLEAIASAVAHRLGERGAPLAARLPVLRNAVVNELIRRSSLRNAVIAGAVFVPGVDMPILTLNQVRLATRIGAAHGRKPDRAQAVELLGVVGAGFAFRAVARQALDVVPVAGWAVKAGVAYGGTKAVGEAARRFFAERA
jgi:uncharacterized protein (DUF697 family)